MSCGLSHAERRARLEAEYGHPKPVKAAAALRLAGLRDQVHPNDVVAFAYRDEQAADAYDKSNTEHNGLTRLALAAADDGGCIGILDLRNWIIGSGGEVTPPGKPDDWSPAPTAPPGRY